MITSTEEGLRHDGGPLEKTHLKDMVQRNALETLVFNKITKNIETEKKAFTRQNTRDESEMKHLLLRLHQRQQTTLPGDEELSSESDDEDDTSAEPREIDKYVNPYPVTIIPRFGAPHDKSVNKQDSAKLTSEALKQLEDSEVLHGHLQLSHPTISSAVAPASSTSRHRDRKSEWLGDPEAILSVRRPRKPGSDPNQRKTLMRSQSEQNALGDFVNISSSASVLSTPRERSNSFISFKEKKPQTFDGDEMHVLNKRGGSLKERPRKNMESTKNTTKPLVRSYSMLTKASLQELQSRCVTLGRSTEHETKVKSTHREDSESVSGIRNWRKTKHGSLKEKKDKVVLSRTDTGASIKQSLSRKSSTEGESQSSKEPQPPHRVLTRKTSNENKKKGESENNQQVQGGLRNHSATYISADSGGFSNSPDENVLRTMLSPTRKQTYRPGGPSPKTSPNCSPHISPLVRDQPVFKY